MINNEIKEQFNEEFKIEKYPMAKSYHLIEYFLIMGYEELYIKEKIIKNINSKIELNEKENENSKEKKIYNFKCGHLPTILSSISTKFSEPIAREELLIKNVFPIPPNIFFTSPTNFNFEPQETNVIFSNIQNDVVNIYYAYIFYEKYYAYNKSFIYIPKAFVILSQYPFFNTFKNFCKELLYNQFKNNFLEIPIEIQLYNIINFIPAPINQKLNITFFQSYDLSSIIKTESEQDFYNLIEQKMYTIEQLSGYRNSEIDFSIIFCILPLDIIVQVYLQILTGHNIGFFSKNIEILSSSIYIFQQLFYPLSYDENVSCLSPIKFFCYEYCIQNLVGFLCSYEEIDKYNPFKNNNDYEFQCLTENEEKENMDYNLFACDYIVDLDNKYFKEVENIKNMENYEEYKNKNFELFNFIYNLYNNEEEEKSELEISIIKLINSLKNIKSKLKFTENDERIPNFFNNNTSFNHMIQETFYKFNLEISFLYFQNISMYNGDYRISKNEQLRKNKSFSESDLNHTDFLFLNLFSQTYYCNILNNFVGGFSQKELSLYKTPRLIFDYFLSLKRILKNKNIDDENLTKNYFRIIDNIYYNNEKTKEKNINFLNFYKYYKQNLDYYIYSIVNKEYINAKLDKNDEKNFKYYYEYKKIDLDRDLIMEYTYIIEEMDKEKIKNLFNLDNVDRYSSFLIYNPIVQKISIIELYNRIENYYIFSNLIENSEILIFSMINMVCLSIHQKTLIPFSITIYNLFQKIFFSLRKYIEIILSISLRLLIKDKIQNLFLYEKYFNLYPIAIEDNNLFPNNQLIYLKKEIYNISLKIKNNYKEIIDDKYKKLEGLEDEKLYSLESQKNYKDIINIIEDNKNNLCENIKNKIIFKSKYYKYKIITYNDIFSPKVLYKISNQLLNNYYIDLDFNKVNKYQYDKILICLLFYSHIFQNDFPKDINKFLFYCLINDSL